MLHHPALMFFEKAKAQKMPVILAEVSKVSEHTLRDIFKGKKQISKNIEQRIKKNAENYTRITMKQNGFSGQEIEDKLGGIWNKGLYASLVSSLEEQGKLEYPFTVALATEIDDISKQLTASKDKNSIIEFRKIILTSKFLEKIYFCETAHEYLTTATPKLLVDIQKINSWEDVHKPILLISFNSFFSLIASLDVEVYKNSFSHFEPRPLFSMVLPKPHPKLDVKAPKKQRDAFWFPVRRFLDFIACICYFNENNNTWPEKAPRTSYLIQRTQETEGNFKNWRDNTKRFKEKDFFRIWDNALPDMNALQIYPFFIAAIMFQAILVGTDANSKNKSILTYEHEYQSWWEMHLNKLKAKGLDVGTAPWPKCLNEL